VDALIVSLEAKPDHERLRAAPQAIDLAVLKRLAEEGWVRDRARQPHMVARLWAACGLPDFRKVGVDPHARFVARLFGHLSEGQGHVPHDWFAAEIARLDNVQGDVETLAGRIAAARSWAYIAHRADWLADPAHWAERTRAIEERLSDALHASLTQRFVDRRTTLLMRQIGADVSALPVVIGDEGEVLVEDHPIGRLEGFRFTVAAEARHADKKLLLAAAEKRLAGERARRGAALAEAPDNEIALAAGPGSVPELRWRGHGVARLARGASLAGPRVVLDRSLDCLDRPLANRVRQRLAQWLAGQVQHRVPILARLDALSRDEKASPALRAASAHLLDSGAIAPRAELGDSVDRLDPDERRRLRQAGVTIGSLDLFDPRLLKPEAARWRAALVAAFGGNPVAAAAPEGATVLPRQQVAGFRPLGAQAVRIDLVERIARAAHDARRGKAPFAPDPALATSMGLAPETLVRLMAALGFRSATPADGAQRWQWRGRPRPPRRAPAAPKPGNAFAALADWGAHGG
jgi:ATP-dependent RNA helicase SUPV3L1/SUV3